MTPDAWRGRRVLLTGHTGFKGAWLLLWLQELGASVTGLALPPEHDDGTYALLGPWPDVDEHLVDIRDADAVAAVVTEARPEVVLHLAAQALVRRGYDRPSETFAVNVQGTANVLAAAAASSSVQATLVVTSDKVYEPTPDGRPHVESDPLGGRDPYSASKAAAELVVRAWPEGPPRATARAGNVIGGGDQGADRLVPDVLAAHQAGRAVTLRYPEAVRPWQFVLEPLSGYLTHAEHLLAAPSATPRALNFGPSATEPTLTVAQVVSALAERLDGLRWTVDDGAHPEETALLRLDASAAASALGWRSRSSAVQALGWTVDWHRQHQEGGDLRTLARHQIQEFSSL